MHNLPHFLEVRMISSGISSDFIGNDVLFLTGQKRKLCVGMALIGGSKIVFLDEPTR